MKFLRADNHVTFCGETPIDMNNRENECTAIELTLPTGLSPKAQKCWDYFDGAAFIFEYCGRLVVTDESLYLTVHGDGSPEAPYGSPRWIRDSWEELEQTLEGIWDVLVVCGDVEPDEAI